MSVRYKKSVRDCVEEYEAESVLQLVEMLQAVEKFYHEDIIVTAQMSQEQVQQLQQEVENYAQRNTDQDETQTQEEG